MKPYRVAINRYRKKTFSLRKSIDSSNAFGNLTGNEKVFLKPNIVYWSRVPDYPKYGVVTTSRIVEDSIILLNEIGIKDITIGEGIVVSDPKDYELAHHAFESLGYNRFKKKYGIKVLNVFESPFEKIDLGDDIELNFNTDALNCDVIISLPVLKTHSEAKVSLSLKNLKGLIDIPSRKKCHTPDTERDLNFYLARLSKKLPPVTAIIDGIYLNERGPGYDGQMKRSNLLITSSDMFSADKVGSQILGYHPSDVSYLSYYAKENNRPIDLSDVEVVGKSIESVQGHYEYEFSYNEDGTNPIAFVKQGIKGISYRQYDNTTCTYCSMLTSLLPIAITYAWDINHGEPWDDIEVIMGKRMNPTPGKNKTILLGQCMIKKHRNNPDIKEMIPIKGCPVKPENITKAFHQVGIKIPPDFFENLDNIPQFFGLPYKNRFNEFQNSFFSEDAEDETVPPIDDIVVSQFYLDCSDESNNLPKKQAKLEVHFFGLVGEKNTNAIKNIIVEGPNSYKFQFKNQPFDFQNGNGYVVDNYSRQVIRYLAFDRNGFLEDGKYRITVDYWNGETRSKSRILKSNHKLLNNYLKLEGKITHNAKEVPKYMEDPKIYADTTWTTLNDLGGEDAFYANYLSQGRTEFVNLHDLTHIDNIYQNRILMPFYGLNKNSALVNTRWKPLKPNTEYTWFVEICDSNKYSNINLTVYQPHQYFKTN
ncbi:MAG: DUF362 domain-containing protein [Promethearchaeota archaeon]|jgi:uncharacterized protein (DUF362 family)